MFDANDDFFELTDSLKALAELQSNTDSAVLAQRASERLEIRIRIEVRSANVSARRDFAVEGVTADISNGGCQVILGFPLMVGDYFSISFKEHPLELDNILCRCLRCRLIQDDAFEVGFRFEHNLDLQSHLSSNSLHSDSSAVQ